MVKHIVMFKLADKSPENLEKVVAALRGMEGKIDTLRHLEVGVDFKNSERSFDLVLTTHFESPSGLATYSSHPVHLPVVDLIQSLCTQTVVVDYETP
ncbi:MAG: Dabb family protein [Nitrospinaceae bacterium]